MCSPMWRAAKVHHYGTTAGPSCKYLIWCLQAIPFICSAYLIFKSLPIALITGSVIKKCPGEKSFRSEIIFEGATIQPGRHWGHYSHKTSSVPGFGCFLDLYCRYYALLLRNCLIVLHFLAGMLLWVVSPEVPGGIRNRRHCRDM